MSFRSLASLRVAAFIAVSLFLTACEGDRPEPLSGVETIEVPTADPGAQANQNIANPTLVIPDTFPVADGDALTLVWSDEFDGPEIDPETWYFETGDGTDRGIPGWGNDELQYYLPDNAQIVNGVLELTARRETVGGYSYTSARINTEDRFAFKYGRIEASIKLPAGQGFLPAFWMLSEDSDYVCGVDEQGNDISCVWAAIGEIDIVEGSNLGGTGGNEILGTIHYGTQFQSVFSTEYYTPSVDVTESFNTYALEWDEDEIRWYFNGLLYAVQNSWFSVADNGGPGAPFNQNFHILLNLAVGGNLPGPPNGTTPFPATMAVDWVRVYSGEDPAGAAAIEPNTSAPTPMEDAADVISLFSDAYDDIAGIDYNPDWDQATVVTIAQIAGNEMLRYGNLDFQGIDFSGNPQDVSAKEYLHVDFWTADSTALNVYLISAGSEVPYALPVTPNSWVSVDIPLTEFAGVDLANLIQLKFDGNGTVFLDNLYFAGDAPVVVAPTVAAATPTEAAADVVSLFSNAYTDVTVGDFSTTWDTADVSDEQVAGDDVKKYVPTGGNATLGFIGINFDNANAIDGTGYDTLRMDVWTPDVTNLLVKLVDFGGDGFQGALADTTGTSTQVLTPGSWQTISIPFSEFITNGLAGVTELSQIVLEDLDGAAGGTTLYVDNLYFFNSAGSGGSGGTAPTVAAATPTEAAADVVSLFSNAYTDVTVGDFSTTWDTADVSDEQVAGDDVKKYVPTGGNATLGFIGINFDNANAIDGTGYDTLRMDVWTPDVTNLLVKLVDFGGDGFQGALADSTGTSTQVLTPGSWQTISIPFSEFITNGLAGVTELSQIVLEDLDGAAGGTTLYVDNLYFFNSAGSGGSGGTAPTVAAATPTEAAADVVSLFSNAYTDVTVGDFSTTWDTADVSDEQVAGDDVKKYVPTGGNATLGFIGINFDNANAIDGTGYDTLRMDVWTPDVTNLLVKLVDFGGDGFQGALADTTGTSTQVLTPGSWQTISIPFSEFITNGLAGVTELSQIVLEDLDGAAGGTTLYVDNLYFFNSAGSGGSGGTAPTVAAATPTEAAADVVSLFSNAYTDVTVGDFSTTWDTADVSDEQVAGDDVKKYVPTGGNATLGFIGINFDNANAIDGTGYDTLRMDVWTPDVTNLLVKLVDFGGDGFQGALADSTGTSTQVLTPGSWQTISIPFSEFITNGLAGVTELSQIVLEDLDGAAGGTTLYVDNLYFFNSAGSGGSGGTAPTVAAATPTEAAADVVSLFSNAYTDVTVGDFSTTWDTADVSDEQVAGDDVKKYVPTGGNATLGFIGINFDNANAIDGTGYDTLRMDVWTPDVTNLLVKLVDFGGDGFQGALADTTGTSTQVLTPGSWQTISIPFSEFITNGLAGVTELSQIVLEDLDGAAGGTTLYVDNLYFFNSAGSGGSGGTAPTVAAATPTEAAADVVSLFSNAYTDVTVGDFSTTWDTADVSDEQVAGDDVKKYVPTGGNATLGFIGINFDNANAIDGTGYDTLRMDVWTPDVTNLLVKLVDFGGDGFQGALADSTGTSTQVLTPGSWQTISIPFSEFITNGLAGVTELSQIVLEDLDGAAGGTTLYVDNLYFFNSAGSGGSGGGGELAVNGDVETGDLTGWTEFPNAGTIAVSSPGAGGSGFAVNLIASGVATGVTIKQANLGAGALTPGQMVTVTFDWKGTDAIGGVVNGVLFSEVDGGGVSQTDPIISGAAFPADWTTVGPLDISIGPDVSGGITLEITAICGADAGCVSNIFIDNVSITTN